MRVLQTLTVPPPRAVSNESHVRLTALLVSALWFDVLWSATRHGHAAGLPPAAAAAIGLASQWLVCALESVAARAAWRTLGRRAAWHELWPRILAASAAEAFAVSIATGNPSLPSWLAQLLAGARAAPLAAGDTGLAFAFAGFGVLALLRMLVSAHAQARLVGARLSHALALVLAFYLATRLAMWWSSDLMQGRSFEPWGIFPCPPFDTTA
jgi:hypothetical protein